VSFLIVASTDYRRHLELSFLLFIASHARACPSHHIALTYCPSSRGSAAPALGEVVPAAGCHQVFSARQAEQHKDVRPSVVVIILINSWNKQL